MICLRLCNYNFLHVRPVKVAVIRPVEPALRRKHRFPRILIQIGRPPAETAVCKNVMLAAAHQQKFHIVVVSSSLQVNPGDIRILLVPILAKLPSGHSAGADGINVPSVKGMSEAEGTAALTKEGFRVVKTDAYSTEYAKGMIISDRKSVV